MAEKKKTTRIKAKDTSPTFSTISVDDKEKKPAKQAAASPSMPAQHCKIESCKREYRAKGYCTFHYKQWRQGKFGTARYTACSDIGCSKPQGMNRHGFCEEHYQSYYIKGNAPKTAEEAAAPAKEETKVA